MEDAKDASTTANASTETPSNDETLTPNETPTTTRKPIAIGKPIIEEGVPKFKPKATKGGKNKYKTIIDQANKLQKGHYLRVPVDDSKDEKKGLQYLKNAMKKMKATGLRADILTSGGIGIIKL